MEHGPSPSSADGALPGRIEEQYRLLMECVTDFAIVMLDPEGRVANWNSGAERIFGYREEEIVGQSFSRLFTPEDRAVGTPENELEAARATNRGNDDRWQFRKDGSRFWASGVTHALRDEQGRLRGFAKVVRDLTAQKHGEEELRRQRDQLAQQAHLLDLAPVLARDEEGRIIFWSKGTTRLYGWSAEEASGRMSHELLRTEFSQPLPEIQAALARHDEWEGELTHRHRDGTRIVVASHWTVHRDAAGLPIAILEVNNDITALKHAQELYRQADRRKDEFLATLGHELRNPLAAIGNALHILRLRRLADSEANWSLGLLERQSRLLGRLVDDLLDVARIARGKIELRKERVNLATVIAQAVEIGRPLLEGRRHQLSLDIPPAPLEIDADPTRLAQIVGNLLNNAAKYTAEGGQVRLSIGTEETRAVIRVRDTGVGIAPEMLPRIFDLYTQVDSARERSQGGLGIGLTLVRSLVHLHGGSVEVHSDGLGKGSEFVVRLPLSNPVSSS